MRAHEYLAVPAALEVIPQDPRRTGRWHQHDSPSPYAKWNVHPEYEIHLITASSGRYIVGDGIGAFGPGQLVLVGPNLPHHWESDLAAGERVPGRDMVLQFHDRWVRACMQTLPELQQLDALLEESAQGIEFGGATAILGAEALATVGATEGVEHVVAVFDLLRILASAPRDDRRLLSRAWLQDRPGAGTQMLVNRALDYIFEHLADDVSLDRAAQLAGMSPSSFSRHFKAAAGNTFSDVVRQLRLTHACTLLEHSDEPVGAIAARVGYRNLSNFNRQFREVVGSTPRDYRRSRRG